MQTPCAISAGWPDGFALGGSPGPPRGADKAKCSVLGRAGVPRWQSSCAGLAGISLIRLLRRRPSQPRRRR